jgi:hypothetical protein
MHAQTNEPYSNRIQIALAPFAGPFVQGGLLDSFDPRRDLSVYVDGVLQAVQTFSFDPANNRYLLFMANVINLQGVIQVIHHVPSPPFVSGSGMAYSLAASPNPTYLTAPVVLTATVTSSAGTPTGTIQFYDGAIPIGSPQTLVSGTASYTDSSLAAGIHPLFAVYTAGESPFVSGISNIVSEEVVVFQTMTQLVVT